MRRGDIWKVSAGGYAGKPRPAVIVQDDRFDGTASVTVCVFTTDETEAPLFRLPVHSSQRNGLRGLSRLMVDKITFRRPGSLDVFITTRGAAYSSMPILA